MGVQSAAGDLTRELQRMRRLSGRSLKELEAHTFVSDSSLSRYMAGRLLPPWSVVAAMSKLVRRDPRELRPLWERAWAVDVVPPTASTLRDFLPRDLPDFTSRSAEIELLLDGLADVDVIDGMAGVGKTTLAVHAAHRLRDRFPDGQFYVNLHGHTPGRKPMEPQEALRSLLTALGLPSAAVPMEPEAAAARWRAELAGRRAIIVLDNAATAAQLLLLLPGNPDCHTIVTSRNRFVDLDGARAVSLDVLDAGSAAELFRRAFAGPAGRLPDEEADNEVVRLCGYLPLGIRLAAARLRHRPTWTIRRLAELLGDQEQRLSTLDIGDRGVATAFGLSYQRLRDDQRRLFRLLGLAPVEDLDPYAAAALAELPVAHAEQLLEELLDVHLVEQDAVDRYRMHDLMREYARQKALEAETASARRAAADRLRAYYLRVTWLAVDRMVVQALPAKPNADFPATAIPPVSSTDQASSWLDAESANLMSVIRHAVADGLTMAEVGLGTGDPRTGAIVLCRLGYLHFGTAGFAEAVPCFEEVVHLSRKHGDTAHLACYARLLTYLGRYDQAAALADEGLQRARAINDRLSVAAGLHVHGLIAHGRGNYDEAIEHLRCQVSLSEEIGQLFQQLDGLLALANTYRLMGELDTATRQLEKADVLDRQIGPIAFALTTVQIAWGNLHLTSGRPEQARAAFEQVRESAERSGRKYLLGLSLHGLGTALAETDSDASKNYLEQSEAILADYPRTGVTV